MSIQVDIRKKFKGFTLDVSFSAGNGRLGLLGASGCGKSMTLKCIAGIETPDEGRITIDGVTVFDSGLKINVYPQLRNAGYLFQNYALFPTMTVAQNIGIAIREEGPAEKKELVGEALRKIRMEEFGGRYPSELSGGQMQRVALARMLAASPRIIMLDEPFSALDSFLRNAMEEGLIESLGTFPGTILFVSHSRDEVYRFCENIAVLDGGKIVAEGRKESLFADPRTLAAAYLTGCRNIAPMIKRGERLIEIPSWGLSLETERPVPDDSTHAGIHAHLVRAAEAGETVNCADFHIECFNESPFTVTCNARTHGSGGSECLRWDYPKDRSAGKVTAPEQILKLCLPAEHLLLLRQS
jgi:molybdate transport system ATP-binding protein